MTTQIIALLAVAALVVGGLAGVTRDDADDSASATAATSADEYCELSAQLNQAGQQAFRRLEQQPNATAQDFQRAEAAFVRRHQGQIDELGSLAPAEIQQDVQLLVASVKARAGLGQPPDPAQAQAAEQRIAQFERENCAAAGE